MCGTLEAMRKIINLKDKRFGRLVVKKLGQAPEGSTSTSVFWGVECDCGRKKTICGGSLRRGLTKSCGCLWQEVMRSKSGRALRNSVLSKYKRAAKTAGRVWDLSDEQFDILTTSDCHYCGITPMVTLTKAGNFGSFTYNGIDRVDNVKGYEDGNVVPSCKICNWAKSTMSYADFMVWLERISKKSGVCWESYVKTKTQGQ